MAQDPMATELYGSKGLMDDANDAAMNISPAIEGAAGEVVMPSIATNIQCSPSGKGVNSGCSPANSYAAATAPQPTNIGESEDRRRSMQRVYSFNVRRPVFISHSI